MTGTEAYILTPVLGLAVLRVLALLLLPLAPLAAGLPLAGLAAIDLSRTGPGKARGAWWRGVFALRPADRVAVLLGILAAPLLLAGAPWLDMLDPPEIFRAGGAWDLDFAGFAAQRLLPLLSAPLDLAAALQAGQIGPDIVRGSILFAAAALPLIFGPALAWRNRRGLSRSGRNFVLVLWGSYATLYSVAVVAWTANQLNFWCFLVLFAASLLLRD